MAVILSGSTSFFRLRHPSKVLLLTEVSPGERMISVRPVQSLKAEAPRTETLSGREMEVRLVQPLKALDNISPVCSGIRRSANETHPLKAASPMEVMVSGSCARVRLTQSLNVQFSKTEESMVFMLSERVIS